MANNTGKRKPYDPTQPLTQEQLFLEQVALAGEYPYNNRHRVISSQTYAKKVITKLTAEKFITMFRGDGLWGYRLTAKGKRYLMDGSSERFSGYFEGQVETNLIRGNPPRRERLHLMAEVYTHMLNSGVGVYQDTKPRIFESPLTAVHTKDAQPIRAPYFYTSREQKFGNADADAIRGSRAAGVLLAPTGVFAVYNTGNRLRRWTERTEAQYHARIYNDFCCEKGRYNETNIPGIMMGSSMTVLAKYLDPSAKKVRDDLISSYRTLYFVTNDKYGETQIRLMCDTSRLSSWNASMRTGILPRNPQSCIENDAMTEDGLPVLFCCSLNIPHLLRFHTGLQIHKRAGVVLCFDFQHEILKEFFGDLATFKVVSFSKFCKHYSLGDYLEKMKGRN
jgi:hypothetical protein